MPSSRPDHVDRPVQRGVTPLGRAAWRIP
jgi:hypothetical protein